MPPRNTRPVLSGANRRRPHRHGHSVRIVVNGPMDPGGKNKRRRKSGIYKQSRSVKRINNLTIMQILIPFPSFTESAAVLDPKTLKNTRQSVLDALKSLLGKTTKNTSSPWVRMWWLHDAALCRYGAELSKACIEKEIPDEGFMDMFTELARDCALSTSHNPKWWTDPNVFASHRAFLLRKNPAYYSTLGWTETPGNAPLTPES